MDGPHVLSISFQTQVKDLEALASEYMFVDSLSVAAMILMAVLLRFVQGSKHKMSTSYIAER
jgi:hypothetical protein